MQKLLLCLTLVLAMLVCAACSNEVSQDDETRATGGRHHSSDSVDSITSAADEIIASAGVEAVQVDVGEIEEGRYGPLAPITAHIPNYTELFMAALAEDDPTDALAKAIKAGEYATVDYQGYVEVSFEGDEQVVDYDDLVKGFIEQELIKAINAVMESEAAK